MTDRELMQQVLRALEMNMSMLHAQTSIKNTANYWSYRDAITALRERLARQEPTTGNVLMDAYNAMESKKQAARQEPETVMAEYKFQTYAAYKADGEMKIGVVPERGKQEPVAWIVEDKYGERLEWAADADIGWGNKTEPLYTRPQAREPLTDEQIRELSEGVPVYDISTGDLHDFARAIEAAHGIKGDA